MTDTTDTDAGPPAEHLAGERTEAGGELATAQAVLRHVVSSLVDDRDAVQIDVNEGRSLPRLSVRVGPSDMGRVIGKRGRVAQAIRTVVRAAAVRDGTDVEVEFED